MKVRFIGLRPLASFCQENEELFSSSIEDAQVDRAIPGYLEFEYFSLILESAIFAIIALEIKTYLTPVSSANSAGF